MALSEPAITAADTSLACLGGELPTLGAASERWGDDLADGRIRQIVETNAVYLHGGS